MRAEADLQQGQLDDAQILLERAYAQIEGNGQTNMTLCCDFLAWRLNLCGAYHAPGPAGSTAGRAAPAAQYGAWRNLFHAICAYYYALRGQTDGIPEVYAAHRMNTVNTLAPGKPMIRLIENQVYLAQGEWAQVLGRGARGCWLCARPFTTIWWPCICGSRWRQPSARLGRQDKGRNLLEQALAQAALDGFVVPLCRNFRDLEPLLEAAQEGPHANAVQCILALGAAQQERCRALNRSEALPEAAARLTERELALARGSLQTAAPTKRSLPGCSSPKAP